MRPRKLLFAAAAALSLTGSAPAYAADPCPNAEFRTGASARLDECRAYELVSPADKNGGTVYLTSSGQGIGMTRAAVDGNAVVFPSWNRFADAVGGMPSSYRSTRDEAGWSTEMVSPPPGTPDASISYMASWEAATPDLETGLLDTADFFDSTDVNDINDIYLSRPTLVELMSRGNGPVRTGARGAGFAGISHDGSHVVFTASDHLVPEDAGRLGVPGSGNARNLEVYDRVGGRTVLLNQVDGGGALINKCGSVFGAGRAQTMRNAISSDGSRIVISVPALGASGDPDCSAPREVYMRVNHEDTIHVSASQRTPLDPAGAKLKTFVGASADGDKVFFQSSEMLTDDAVAGGGTYRYTVSTGDLEFITGRGTSISKVSADGSRLYYVSTLPYTPDAINGQRNLYVYDRGTTRLVVANPSSSTSGLTGLVASAEHNRKASVSHDGRYFVFEVAVSLTSFDHAGRSAIYRYDAVEDELLCVSCDPAGQRPAGSMPVGDSKLSSFQRYQSLTPYYGDDYSTNVNDGGRVVFDSSDRLVAGDTNSKRDVYSFDGERLSLVSSGRSESESLLVGMAAEGRDVFFTTAESLVAADADGGNLDIYTARIGGGLPDPDIEVEEPCSGDGCQGTPESAPKLAGAGSSIFTVPWVDRGDRASARLTVSGARVVRGASGAVRVGVSGKGWIRASGRGLRATSKAAARGGTYRLRLRLSAHSRRALRKGLPVRVRVRVGFTASGGLERARSLTVTFKPTSKALARRSAAVLSTSKGSR